MSDQVHTYLILMKSLKYNPEVENCKIKINSPLNYEKRQDFSLFL